MIYSYLTVEKCLTNPCYLRVTPQGLIKRCLTSEVIMKLLNILAGIACIARGSVVSPYTYREFGADWGTKYPTCLNGQFQSPVNFEPANVQ